MNIKPLFSTATILLFTLQCIAQSIPTHEKKIYKNDEGRIYVNKALPVYLSISTNPDGSNGEVLDGKEPTYSSPMYLDSEGYNTIRSPWKVDPETGKTVYPKEEVIFELYADSKPPSTNIDFSSEKLTEYDGSIITKSVKVSLTATDKISGVQSIYYSIDNQPYTAYTGLIEFYEEKNYSLRYYSLDNVGNAEEVKEVGIIIDDTAPATAIKLEGDQFENVLSARSSIELSAKDNQSKIGKTFYTIDDGKTFIYIDEIPLNNLSEGNHTITYFSIDLADNVEEKQSYSFFVDKSAPRVIDEIIGNTFIANGKEYYSGRTKLKLVAMDNKAGVNEISYSVNGGEFKLYESPFYLSQEGGLNIEVLVTDKVNNRKRTVEFSNKNNLIHYVDLSGPELNHSLSGPYFIVKDTLFISENTSVILKGSDNDAGFKEIDYQIDNGSLETYDEPFSVENEGFHTITFNGYDNLENSSTKSIFCVVDNTGPEVFNRFSINSNKQRSIDGEQVDVYPPHVVLFLSSTDKYAGLDKINYQVNGSKMQPYRSLIENFTKDTRYRINVSVTDKLGNQNQEEIAFYIE